MARTYTAQCPRCPWSATRSKREAAEHSLAQHVAYNHDDTADSYSSDAYDIRDPKHPDHHDVMSDLADLT